MKLKYLLIKPKPLKDKFWYYSDNLGYYRQCASDGVDYYIYTQHLIFYETDFPIARLIDDAIREDN